jgi:monothiol glutaredoxin
VDLDHATRDRLTGLIASDRVVLFMKGERDAPRCGFSATVCRILDHVLPEYSTVDVLSDPSIREGIKAFSSWPTIPQLYVDGVFIGGCEVVREMLAEGGLLAVLGVEAPEEKAPEIEITGAAATALARLAREAEGRVLHLSIDARLRSALFFAPHCEGDLRVESKGVALFVDPLTARRAVGVAIDAVETSGGPAFQIDNPNAAPASREIDVRQLKARLDAGERFELYDVRDPEERAVACLDGSRLLDPEAAALIETLDPDTPLFFYSHHGRRSRAAAEHFAALGFRNAFSVAGGIDVWSREIDPSVPRY